MNRGLFITFEGGEGAGKSTQAKLLAARLEGAGVPTLVTREPGGTPLGEDLRAIILKDRPQDPVTELLLFAAARAEHMTAVIRPALDDGTWVISDRFMDSTRVYQGRLYSVEPELIKTLERYTVAPDFPSLTLILDLPPEAGLERASTRGTLSRYDAERIETHRTLRQGFLAC
jgi:dTMP kinase